jgi:bacillithiol biosynthesis deacetylase BshB1
MKRPKEKRRGRGAAVAPARADVLAFGAHPDDVELTCAGTLLKLRGLGHRTGVVDLTRGEKGSRGDPATRRREAEDAAGILGLSFRRNLELPDAAVDDGPEAVRLAVEAIREARPSLVIAPWREDPHPDHEACSRLVRKACFLAGMAKADARGEPFRPSRLLFAMYRVEFRPSFVVDVSACFPRALEAVRAHRSQVGGPGPGGARAGAPRPDYLDGFVRRAKYYGGLIGAEYGEPFLSLEMLEIEDPVKAFRGFRGLFGGGLR